MQEDGHIFQKHEELQAARNERKTVGMDQALMNSSLSEKGMGKENISNIFSFWTVPGAVTTACLSEVETSSSAADI